MEMWSLSIKVTWGQLMRHEFLVIVLVTAAVISGCVKGDQPELMPVSGKVMMEVSGITAGALYFHPDPANSYQKDSPSSQLQLDGSFTMKTFPFGDGVPAGKYKVTIIPELAARLKHPEYADVQTTPWQIEVTGTEVKDHVFEIK